MDRLTAALQREQGLLERLLFKLVETRLLLAAGETRFVRPSAREVERARQRTCAADLARAAVVDGLGTTDPNSRQATLRDLAANAPEPWAGMLRDHHDAMCGLVAEIELVAHNNARDARSRLRRLDLQLKAMESGLEGPEGGSAHCDGQRPTLALVADHTAYETVLVAADGLRMPALLAFLR